MRSTDDSARAGQPACLGGAGRPDRAAQRGRHRRLVGTLDAGPAGILAAAVAALLIAAACGRGGTPPGAPAPPSRAPSAGTVLRGLPSPIAPGAHYLIYLHNQFWENAAPGDLHPQFGLYDYEGILAAFAARGLTVIAERREPGADPPVSADRVVRQIRDLVAAGTPASAITVVGFSKGGAIAILASSGLADDGVNFVILAGCGRWLASRPDLVPRGRMLSVFEASDDLAGSCQPLFDRAPSGSQTNEIELQLGGGHGAFFVPHREWIEPTVAWALER